MFLVCVLNSNVFVVIEPLVCLFGFSHLGFWSGSLFLIAPFPDLCLLVLSYIYLRTPWKIGENLIGQPHKIKKLISY